jgi:Uma2 family endonuclease
MATTPKLMTAEELWRLPDDNMRHELVAGELRTMSPGGEEHGGIAALFVVHLGQYVIANKLGRVLTNEPGFLLTTDPDTVRAPDVAFVRQERIDARGPSKGYRRGAPDLAVEVVSPNDLYTEVAEKVDTWLAHGTRLVVVVDPRRRTVAVHRPATPVRHLTVDAVLDGEDVVPGWTMPIKNLFV